MASISSNMTSLNVSVAARYRDIAFAVGGMAAVLAVVLAGAVHRFLLGAGASLAHVFLLCGAVGTIGGVILILYSVVTRRGREISTVLNNRDNGDTCQTDSSCPD